ncbi:MAG: DUF2141 domain-containing protein [Pseudomonadota bacterium]
MTKLRAAARGASLALTAAIGLSGVLAAEDASAAKGEFDHSFEHVSCTGAPNEVRVTVQGVDESIGLMRADLYRNDADGFLKRAGRVAKVSFAAKAPFTQFCMRAPIEGDFAIAVYHDENANKTFDKKAFGLPDEPYGISNDPVIRFAPPKVEEALFSVPKDGAAVVITLKE